MFYAIRDSKTLFLLEKPVFLSKPKNGEFGDSITFSAYVEKLVQYEVSSLNIDMIISLNVFLKFIGQSGPFVIDTFAWLSGIF